jgi:hypothetical protein
MKAMDDHRVAGLDRVGDLGGEVRRGLDLRAVRQDQPVDIAARRQRELLDLAMLGRQLLRIVERRGR